MNKFERAKTSLENMGFEIAFHTPLVFKKGRLQILLHQNGYAMVI